MKTLIAYTTTHGCTEKVVAEISDFLKEEITLCNLKKDQIPDLQNFDRIIIGGSIHAGQIQKSVKNFCTNYQNEILKTELGLFICCMEKGEKAYAELQEVYPEVLLQHAKATACLGGEFNFEKMNFLEKMIIRKVSKVDHSISEIDHKAVRTFTNKMAKGYNPFFFFV